MMQPITLLAWALALRQALAVRLIVHQSNLTDALQQILLTFGDEQNLIGAQRTQRPRGSAPTDPSLVLADTIEERFQLQVVGRQSRHIITRQHIARPRFPQPMPGALQR